MFAGAPFMSLVIEAWLLLVHLKVQLNNSLILPSRESVYGRVMSARHRKTKVVISCVVPSYPVDT